MAFSSNFLHHLAQEVHRIVGVDGLDSVSCSKDNPNK